jgi:hypothetical protein
MGIGLQTTRASSQDALRNDSKTKSPAEAYDFNRAFVIFIGH